MKYRALTSVERAEQCLHVQIERYWRFRDNPDYDRKRLCHRIEVAERFLLRQRHRAGGCG